MKKFSIVCAAAVAGAATVLSVARLSAQDTITVPKLPYRAIYDFFKITPDTNFGEVLGVAVNSKGNVIVLNHPGTASSGPLYGNATTQLLEFDANGKFVREWGKGVYGLGYAHSVRFDRYDNLWVADKGTDSVMKFKSRRLRGHEPRPPARRLRGPL